MNLNKHLLTAYYVLPDIVLGAILGTVVIKAVVLSRSLYPSYRER